MTDRLADSLVSRSFGAEDVAVLRRLVAKHAAAVGLSAPRLQDFVLAVDEIVTNAVRHGGGGGELDVWLTDSRLWFRVTDRGPGLSAELDSTPPRPTQLGGRGIWISRQVTDELTIASGPGGTVVTGVMALP